METAVITQVCQPKSPHPWSWGEKKDQRNGIFSPSKKWGKSQPHFFALAKYLNQNPVPWFFFASQPHENACHAGYVNHSFLLCKKKLAH